MKKLLTVLAAVVFTGGAVYAQATASHSIEVSLSELVGISILTDNAGDGALVNPFQFDTPAEYNDGIEVLGGVIFAVNASVDWVVNFKSTDAQFENADASETMPLSVLSIKETLGGSYATLATTDKVLTSGSPLLSILAGVSAFTADYKITPGTTYAPDTYSANVTYTISAQ